MHVCPVNRMFEQAGKTAALVLALATIACARAGDDEKPEFDLSHDKVLYCIGYAHLDTQWRWDFSTTIDRFVRDTLDQNFDRFEHFPGYVFNFTGAVRYQMMKEYYPQRYERLKSYIADGRWFVSGSSVDEGDINVVAPESIIRHVLYGNGFFRHEFGKESLDYMLPDCFGFPATLPSILAHCSLKGFSTQKLTWGSAVGIPFGVGVWEGPDGHSIIAALDPGSYSSAVKGRVDKNPYWVDRVNTNGQRYGVWTDYHYYGVGDQGGAPHAEDVQNYLASVDNPDSEIHVALTSSDQMYKDITPEQRARLPRYKGDLLLTQHSAGTLTSEAYMKRWNRKNEILADAAERAAVAADWLGGAKYPHERLRRSWFRTLANQMHDILPGTSIPRAYTYSWNDETIAGNGFASVLEDSVGAISRGLNTQVQGVPLVVYNPLSIEREDLVTAEIPRPQGSAAVRVFDSAGRETPSQVLDRDGDTWRILFVAHAAPISWSVFDVRPSSSPSAASTSLHVDEHGIENERYKVTIDSHGDVASIVDKRESRELLSGPAKLVFTHEKPHNFPAWNMDWADRQLPPLGVVDGKPKVRVVENGPVRVALEIERESRGSIFTQRLQLATGAAGQHVEFATTIDWQSSGCALRQSFPLTVSNPLATYNWGAGTIQRGNIEPTRYEVPSHEWFDLTDQTGDYGVSVLENCKFGSDKPSDNELRLTLLYTPAVRESYMDQHSQDWGRHNILYALYGHPHDWRGQDSFWQGRRLNQPLRVFTADKHDGELGREWSLAKTNSKQVALHALKKAEESDWIVIRLQELWGQDADNVRVSFARPIAEAQEVDGQERRIGDAKLDGGQLQLHMTPYAIRAFAVRLSGAPAKLPAPQSTPATLAYDSDVASSDADRTDGGFDVQGRTYPAEMLPHELVDGDIRFVLGPTADGKMNAVACRGQTIELPDGEFDHVHLLAAADQDTRAGFRVGDRTQQLDVQSWTGFIGQWDNRVWDRTFPEVDYHGEGKVTGIRTGYIKPARVAWFATHRHSPAGNEAYKFSYLFHHVLDIPANAHTLTLPDDPSIRVFAVSVSRNANIGRPAAPLQDDFSHRKPIEFRYKYPVPPPPVFKDVEALGAVTMDREDTFEALKMGPPSDKDYADASRGTGIAFRYYSKGNDFVPHVSSGADGDRLPRLNDGVVAQNHDDTDRCVWYDCEGRFYVDLQHPVSINAVKTYSWHRSNRAPQYFSLWGATGDEMPSAGFTHGHQGAWQLLGVVDSRKLGNGGKHGSSITSREAGKPLGKYRYLLWVAEDQGQGTFFTEIDVDAQP